MKLHDPHKNKAVHRIKRKKTLIKMCRDHRRWLKLESQDIGFGQCGQRCTRADASRFALASKSHETSTSLLPPVVVGFQDIKFCVVDNNGAEIVL